LLLGEAIEVNQSINYAHEKYSLRIIKGISALKSKSSTKQSGLITQTLLVAISPITLTTLMLIDFGLPSFFE
tara:strand:+ start:357 stop:572 length:216 start_codon:yes stop_codon:yes gene_type:complete